LFQILPVLKPVYYFAESKSFLSNSAGQFIIFNSQKTTRHVIKHLCFFVLLFLDVAFLRADVKGLTKEFISIFYCFSPLNNKTWLSIFSSIFFWTACLLGYSFFFLNIISTRRFTYYYFNSIYLVNRLVWNCFFTGFETRLLLCRKQELSQVIALGNLLFSIHKRPLAMLKNTYVSLFFPF